MLLVIILLAVFSTYHIYQVLSMHLRFFKVYRDLTQYRLDHVIAVEQGYHSVWKS